MNKECINLNSELAGDVRSFALGPPGRRLRAVEPVDKSSYHSQKKYENYILEPEGDPVNWYYISRYQILSEDSEF